MYRELFVAGGMLILAGIFYSMSGRVEIPEACVFPVTVMAAMLVLTMIHLAQSIFRICQQGERKTNARLAAGRNVDWRSVAIALTGILLYAVVMERLGFYLSGLLFYLAISLLLQHEPLSIRGAAVRLAMVTVFMGVLFILFSRILAVQLPKGLLM